MRRTLTARMRPRQWRAASSPVAPRRRAGAPDPRARRRRLAGAAPAARPTSCASAAERGGLLCLLTDTVDGACSTRARPARGLQLRGRDRQRRPRRLRRARHPGRQHARRAHRRDRRPRVRAASSRSRGGCPRRERAVRAGEWRDVGAGLAGSGAELDGRDARDRRPGPHRPGGGAARGGLRDGGRSTARAAATPLDELLERADVVTLHCPLTAETRHLIDADALDAHEADRAARQHRARPDRRPGGARATRCTTARSPAPALDVTDPEPLPADHPLLQRAEPDRPPPRRLGHARTRHA